MKNLFFIFFLFLITGINQAQTVTPAQDYEACDEDGDGFVTIPFSVLQNYALDILEQFNESPEIYVTKAQNGISKITNLYNNPQVVNVCGNTDGEGGYYDIAINNQQEIYIVRKYGLLQKVNLQNCTYQDIGQIHPNGQSVLALSFDHLNHLYEGGWTSQVFRADAQNLQEFHLWHDFGTGRAAGDFVQIGNFLYVAWTMPDGNDHLYKVTLGANNQYVNHEDLGTIDTGTYGLAAEYGKLYGNTPDYLYEIDLDTMETIIIRQRPNQNNYSSEWWGAAGFHEALNIQITYHNGLDEAMNGTSPLNDPYTNSTPFSDVVYIRVHEASENETYIIPINIIITVAPEANDTSRQECKDEQTGMATFQLDETEIDINPNSDLNFSFFASLNNLENNENPLPLTYSISESTTVYVKVHNGNGDNCYGIAELDLIIHAAENINYEPHVSFCYGTEAILSVPDEFDSYQWNGLQGEDLNQPLNTNEIVITYPGSYSVLVTGAEGCSFSLPFEAILGGAPEITNVEINGNSIIVHVSPSGNYEYSLNGIFWQSSPVFQNIEVADYDIYVRDFTGCTSDKYEFSYFMIPNFISPNNDGYNDVWQISGIDRYPGAKFMIFDRYGKLFAERTADANGIVWDGKYLGNTVPSGTYWYMISIPEQEQKIKGFIVVKN